VDTDRVENHHSGLRRLYAWHMPTIQIALELAARPIPCDGRWAVRCLSCSPSGIDTVGLGLENISLSFDLAQRVADLHNKVVHGIER
jgi:hypothetical protein